MRLAFLALALTVPAASSELPAAPAAAPPQAARSVVHSAMPSRLCRDDLKVRPIRSREAARPRRLGELPPGDLTLTVVNRVGECIEPVTVRQGFGALGDGTRR